MACGLLNNQERMKRKKRKGYRKYCAVCIEISENIKNKSERKMTKIREGDNERKRERDGNQGRRAK